MFDEDTHRQAYILLHWLLVDNRPGQIRFRVVPQVFEQLRRFDHSEVRALYTVLLTCEPEATAELAFARMHLTGTRASALRLLAHGQPLPYR